MSGNTYSTAPGILRETARGIDCIRIEDELMSRREIFLTDEVNAGSMNSLLKQMMYLCRDDPEKEITLYINSPGGEVTSGFAVYDYLILTRTPIRTVCVGQAASMAAILFLAGDRREMLPHSELMIHDPAPAGGSLQGMKPAELAERLDRLKTTQKALWEAIARATGLPPEEIRSKTEKDSWFSAEEAVACGLATAIVDRV